MLKLTIIEFILRFIPETTLEMTSVYIFSGEKINFRRITLSGVLLAIFLCFVRTLPIQFGVHTLIFSIVLILIAIWVNKIDVNKAISSSLISIGLLSVCDWVSFFIITNILKDNVKSIISTSYLRILYGFPSLVLYVIIILVIYKIMHRSKLRDIYNQ